jgi:hypothetical protein
MDQPLLVVIDPAPLDRFEEFSFSARAKGGIINS